MVIWGYLSEDWNASKREASSKPRIMRSRYQRDRWAYIVRRGHRSDARDGGFEVLDQADVGVAFGDVVAVSPIYNHQS